MVDQAIMKRIAALLQKTVDNGCTQEEAAAAATKASELMHAYQITQSAAELGAEGIIHLNLPQHSSPTMTFGVEFDIRAHIGTVAEKYCGIKSWSDDGESKRDKTKGMHIVGLKSDIEMAVWMLDTLSVVAWRLAVERTAHVPGERRTHRKNFIRGFKDGLCEQAARLLRERNDQHKDIMSDGKSLVLVKQELIKDRVDSMNLGLRMSKNTITNRELYLNGLIEGNNANLGRPIQTGTQRLLK